MFDALKKYAVFRGRARRKEYWLFLLLYTLLFFATTVVDGATDTYSEGAGMGLLGFILTLAFLVPSVAVGVRRLHDIDKCGWWLLILLVPVLGFLVLHVFFCFNGTVGDNRFGEDPKGRERASS